MPRIVLFLRFFSLGFGVLEYYHLSTNHAAPFWPLLCGFLACISICWSGFFSLCYSHFCPNFYIYFPYLYTHKSFWDREYMYMHMAMSKPRLFYLILTILWEKHSWYIWFADEETELTHLAQITWLVRIAKVRIDSKSPDFKSTFWKRTQ